MALANLMTSGWPTGPALAEDYTTMRTFKRTSTGAVFRVIGSAAGDLAELAVICIFIGAVGIWAHILGTV